MYGPLACNCLPKEIRLCDEIEAFKRILKTRLFVKFVNESTLAIWFGRIIVKRPKMLSAQFVALYKPCKPKPNLCMQSDVILYHVIVALVCMRNAQSFDINGTYPTLYLGYQLFLILIEFTVIQNMLVSARTCVCRDWNICHWSIEPGWTIFSRGLVQYERGSNTSIG